MQRGDCFIYYDEFLYQFPDLECSDNSTLPAYVSTSRVIYKNTNGTLVKLSEDTVVDSTLYTGYVAHIYNGSPFFWLDANYLVLPAVLIVLSFLAILWRWFIRMRG